MPSDPSSKPFSADALDAFLEGLLAELKSPADPVMLGQIRASFRRKIPFHLRSYAAAILIMRAAGLSRGVSARPQPEAAPAPAPAPVKPAEPRSRNPKKPVLAGDPSTRSVAKVSSLSGSAPSGSLSHGSGNNAGTQFQDSGSLRQPAPPAASPRKPLKEVSEKTRQEKPEKTKPRSPRAEVQETAIPVSSEPAQVPAPKPRQTSWALSVPSTPLFVSMGRRQRLRAAEIRELFIEKSGLGADEVGQVRLFDNYCFIDIATDKAMIATEAMNGAQLRGRAISVGPAKPRGEMARETATSGNFDVNLPSTLSAGTAHPENPTPVVATTPADATPPAFEAVTGEIFITDDFSFENSPEDDFPADDVFPDDIPADDPVRGPDQV